MIEDVLERVDRFMFPTDFIIMVFSANQDTLILLGRLFLKTRRTLIGVENRELAMKVNGQRMVFNVLNALKYPKENIVDCNLISN